MKFIGRDWVREYTDEDSRRQEPGADTRWQDSAWLQWWDPGRGVGGVHRIGHEYNVDGGPFVAAWSNLVTPAGIYKKVTYLPLRPEDQLPDGWGCGDGTSRMEVLDEGYVWTIDDPDAGVSARLAFDDHHGAFCGFPNSGATAHNITAHHLDVAGDVRGTIRLGGEQYNVAGSGLRDHGWGHRDLRTLISHRYVTGTFGPDLSFCAFSNQSSDDEGIETFGWVVRDGTEVVFARDIDIVVFLELDSISVRGGRIRFDLADDTILEAELTAVAPGLMNVFHDNFGNLNTLCEARAGDRVGAGMLESSRTLARYPAKMVRALVENGVYPGPWQQLSSDSSGPFIVPVAV